MGAQNHLTNINATWTIRDAYTHALTTTCLEKDADLLSGQESTTPGTFSYRVVRRNFKLGMISFGYYIGEIGVIINPTNTEMPVRVMRRRIGSDAPRASSAECEEHHRWQDDFCKTLLDRVVEIRREWANRGMQAVSSEPTASAATTQTQMPVVSVRDTQKPTKIELAMLIVAVLAVIVAILSAPFLQGTIQHFLNGATPTSTPMLAPPTATP